MNTGICVCRLCLRKESISEMIELNKKESWIKIIYRMTNIVIYLKTNCSTQICLKCKEFLVQFEDFRKLCIQNDVIFRKLYEQTTPDIVNHEECNVPEIDKIKKEQNNEESDSEPPVQIELENNEPFLSEQSCTESIEKHETERKYKRGRPKKGETRLPAVKITKKRGRPRTEKLPKSSAPKVQCQTCGKLVNKFNFARHLSIHDPDRPMFPCSVCEKSYPEKRFLEIHINSAHTREINYPCDQCEKVYLSTRSLRTHFLAAHTDIKRYPCKFCGMKFAQSALRYHHYFMAHSDVKQFACEYCDKAFKKKGDLTIHTRTHTGEKPFKCDICSKRFNKSYNMTLHKRTHRQETKAC
ncbi:zinc finger protein 37-like [Uranotaenia lowii]|uniref:zinc finger protein 37-like n=1 Tax=Uranotaenia lowii TaxID=190385 RepID=UPI002479C1D0|nr:zinc finger protein 37-like [Uranotaenia lowii]